ncbi:MAG TPA: tRNA guanosine(34) transglycosylase Tgt, partial [Xanthobacteraceae bacterium]
PAARDYSRAYLHHLVKAGEMLAAVLLTMVNLAYYQELMAKARAAVMARQFEDFCRQTNALWEQGDIPAR